MGEIVGAAHEIEALGQEITWENIGDPVQKGEIPPKWIREIVTDLVDQAESWAYCDTQGVPEVREFLASEVNRRASAPDRRGRTRRSDREKRSPHQIRVVALSRDP